VTGAQALTLEPIADSSTYLDPMSIVSDPGNPDRLLVAERTGKIKLTQAGTTTTFADLSSTVNSTGNQQGIQSIAVPPDFDQSGLLYVFYTGFEGAPGGALHIGVLHASGDTTDSNTPQNVITVPHPDGDGHNGGQIAFGPDGYLYMSTGDGKCCGDPLDNSQDLNDSLGKILRIDPHPGADPPYTIPPDNPFAGSSANDEIWSYGLRNPWRFTFDHETGALVIGDVGNATWEEVDYEPQSAGGGKGDNFGWDCREGLDPYTGPPDAPAPVCPSRVGTFTEPIFEYPHTADACSGSITGGYVVRDTGLGDLFGRYLYSDFCVGELRSLTPVLPSTADDRSEGITLDQPISFAEDSACRLYVIEFDDDVFRLSGDAPSGCPPHPAAPAATTLKLKAKRHRVEAGKRAKLTAKARPCAGRVGDRVTLFRSGKKVGSRRLSASCKARFRPKIKRRWKFKAKIGADAEHLADSSNRVKIRLRPH
jgi:glucose/arabinose dehydrogenase